MECGRTLYGLSIPFASSIFLMEAITFTCSSRFGVKRFTKSNVPSYGGRERPSDLHCKSHNTSTHCSSWLAVENLVSFHQSKAMLCTNASTMYRCPLVDKGFNLCQSLQVHYRSLLNWKKKQNINAL